MPSPIRSMLIVDDDSMLRKSLELAFAGEVEDLRSCETARDAAGLLQLWTPSLVLLDVMLPDGSAFDVLEALAGRSPFPIIIAISGTATARHAFALAKLGVRDFLQKPFTLAKLKESVRAQLEQPQQAPALEPPLQSAVGCRRLFEVEDEVRRTMVREAIARANGSRKQAAKLLGISRQALQHILRQLDG